MKSFFHFTEKNVICYAASRESSEEKIVGEISFWGGDGLSANYSFIYSNSD
jgi:hypothetical protein